MRPRVYVIVKLEAVPRAKGLQHPSALSGIDKFIYGFRYIDEIRSFRRVFENFKGRAFSVFDAPDIDKASVRAIPLVTRS